MKRIVASLALAATVAIGTLTTAPQTAEARRGGLVAGLIVGAVVTGIVANEIRRERRRAYYYTPYRPVYYRPHYYRSYRYYH